LSKNKILAAFSHFTKILKILIFFKECVNKKFIYFLSFLFYKLSKNKFYEFIFICS